MKVLVAEDNPNGRQLVKDILDSVGYEPILAVDGPSAIEAALAEMPDLIILDVNMPGMSGFEVLEVIRADGRLAHIPVLMLTAQTDMDSRVAGLGLGADDYLAKPFSPRELAARIDARLRRKIETDDLRKTQEMIRHTFERFVSPSVVERLLEDPTGVKLGGQLQDITVLFSDLQGFTRISEQTAPEKLLGILNLYHSLVVSVIQEAGGTVDKFMGDGVMALFNTPLHQPDHPYRAVSAALHIRTALSEFVQQFEPEYQMPINFGIHSGLAVVGNIGAQHIMDFTAVGDTVNLASRLQGLGKNGQILISEDTYSRLEGRVRVHPIGVQNVRGRLKGVMVYEALELQS